MSDSSSAQSIAEYASHWAPMDTRRPTSPTSRVPWRSLVRWASRRWTSTTRRVTGRRRRPSANHTRDSRLVIRYHARWVVPIAEPPVENGTVVVHDGRIAFVGPRADAPAGDDDDLGDVLLMPGLVNAHCHLELTAMRGFLEDLDFRRWILRLTAARRSVLDRDASLDSARLGLEEGVRAGIT